MREALKKPPLPKKKAHKNTGQSHNYEGDLYDQLRELRTRLAKERGVPPYIIFPDRTLKEMAHYRPKTMDEFKQLNGVGEKKAQRYGTEFLNAVSSASPSFNL